MFGFMWNNEFSSNQTCETTKLTILIFSIDWVCLYSSMMINWFKKSIFISKILAFQNISISSIDLFNRVICFIVWKLYDDKLRKLTMISNIET